MTIATQALQIQFRANVAGVACAVDFATLPEASQVFVVEYGLRQYIQDGAAVAKKDSDGNEKTVDAIAAEKAEGVNERLANLTSGEFTRRSAAAKLSPEEKERNSIVIDRLGAAFKAMGKPMPTRTGKKAQPEVLDKLMAAYYAKYQADVDKEVARRMRASPTVDMTELLAAAGV